MTEPTTTGAGVPHGFPASPREHLSSPITRTVLRIQHRMLTAAREHLSAQGFVEMLPPIIGPVTDPGARGAKQIDIDYYGHRYKLMTSAILYKQASLLAFDKIFYVAPNVRLEPLETSTTGRHLAEFHQIDVEVAGASRDDILQILEDLVRNVVRLGQQRGPRLNRSRLRLGGPDPRGLRGRGVARSDACGLTEGERLLLSCASGLAADGSRSECCRECGGDGYERAFHYVRSRGVGPT